MHIGCQMSGPTHILPLTHIFEFISNKIEIVNRDCDDKVSLERHRSAEIPRVNGLLLATYA